MRRESSATFSLDAEPSVEVIAANLNGRQDFRGIAAAHPHHPLAAAAQDIDVEQTFALPAKHAEISLGPQILVYADLIEF